MVTARSLVLHYLQTLSLQGERRLGVDDEARGILRSWMLAARSGTPLPPPANVAAAASTATATTAATAPAPASSASGGISDENKAYINTLLNDLHSPGAAQPGGEDQENEVPFFRPGGSTPEEIWENFARLLPNWKPLRELGTLRTKPVFGTGDRQASIMFVGDAPNYHDEKAGEPFQGEAGGKLNGMLKAMGLTREQIYLTHLVKFRPSLPRQTTNNRPPNEKEIRFSAPIVELEAKLVRPKVIVALGVISARGLLDMGDIPLSAYRRQQGQFCGVPVVVTHHPSYLLRTSDLKERRSLWEDMLGVMRLADLPISPRQQSYFLKQP